MVIVFFCVYFIKSLIRNSLLKIVSFVTEHFCSSDIISGNLCFILLANIFVIIL